MVPVECVFSVMWRVCLVCMWSVVFSNACGVCVCVHVECVFVSMWS